MSFLSFLDKVHSLENRIDELERQQIYFRTGMTCCKTR